MRVVSILVLLLGVAAVAAGVLIEGTAQHPMTLFVPYIVATTAVEFSRKRTDAWFRLGFVPVLLGLSAGLIAWTLGAEHVASTASSLVWIGVAVAVAASAEATSAKARGAGPLVT